MPKKRDELKDLTIGQRQQLVFKAVQERGPITIGDVLEFIISTMDIKDSKEVRSTLRRAIENDLRSNIGKNGAFGVSYYYKDGLTKVEDKDLEENENGTIKNKYCVKYYIIGGKSQIQGLSLLDGSNIKVEIPRLLTSSIKVDSAYNAKSGNSFSIVLEKNGNEFSALNFHEDELPLGFLICRDYKDMVPLDEIAAQYGQRSFRMKISHISLERSIPNVRPGHVYVKINPGGIFEITDFKSLNGTFFSKASKNMIDLIFSKKLALAKKQAKRVFSPRPSVDTDLEKMPFDDYYPFHNETEWERIHQQVNLECPGFLLKVGSIIIYVGKSDFLSKNKKTA